MLMCGITFELQKISLEITESIMRIKDRSLS